MGARSQRRRFEGRSAIVTGAASGIGRAVTLMLAREGARVLATDVDAAGADRVAAAVRVEGGTAEGCALDVSREADWERAVDLARTRWNVVDVLVNNAGISRATPITETTLDEWRLVMAVNLDGVFLGLKHAIRAMRGGGGGAIVNVASASGVKPAPGACAYGTSKAGVRMLSRTAALECVRIGDRIRINTVIPAGVRTPMWERMPFFRDLVGQRGNEEAAWQALEQGELAKRFATPEEVADAVLFLASDEAGYINAAEIAVDYGYTA